MRTMTSIPSPNVSDAACPWNYSRHRIRSDPRRICPRSPSLSKMSASISDADMTTLGQNSVKRPMSLAIRDPPSDVRSYPRRSLHTNDPLSPEIRSIISRVRRFTLAFPSTHPSHALGYMRLVFQTSCSGQDRAVDQVRHEDPDDRDTGRDH